MSDVSTTSSGMTGAGGGNMLRITGMATGLDVDAMVKKMMAAEQTKLDKAKQKQQTIQWKQDAYKDIINDIKDLQSSFFDSTSSDKNIVSATNFTPFTVSGGDTSVATFTPGVGAQVGKYSLTVNKVAAGAGISNTLTGDTLSTKLSTIGTADSLKTSINLNLNGINVTLDNTLGNATIGDLVNAINNKAGASVKASFSELTGKFTLNTVSTGASSSLTIGSGTTAALSSVFGFSTDNSTGHTGTGITGTTTTSNWVANSTTLSEVTTGSIASKGENADVTITTPSGTNTFNDASGNAKTTNNFTIDGMTYNLLSTSATPVTVTVGSDTQKVYDKIKGFIDKYNTIVDKIQTKITEKKDSSYQPLTDSQKESMTDSQITAWETKAKVGILRNDDNLSKLLNDLRSAFTTSVKDAGITLGKYGSNTIGLDISTNYDQPAHIDILDESKLKDAILNKGDQILKMFTNVSQATDGEKTYDSSKTQYKEDGIFTRIKNILVTNVGFTNTTLNTGTLTSYANKQYDFSTTGNAGKNTIPDQLYEQQLAIKKITDSMKTKQEAYYQQFSQLETAMTTLTSQQSMLSSMLGS